MRLCSIESCDFSEAITQAYHLYFFASGTEDRASYVFNKMSIASGVVILGFFDHQGHSGRKKNDEIFSSMGNSVFVSSHPFDYTKKINEELRRASKLLGNGETLKIFVDYSAMTRGWYANILTWVQYSDGLSNVCIDFFYSHGVYEREFEPLQIKELGSVPGFEGVCASARQTIALFGLGFDRYATLAVFDQIEPDKTVCFIAQSGLDDPNAERVLDSNSDILGYSGGLAIRAPLSDVKETFRILYEQISQFDRNDEIVLVPMGPKPHVLASLLLSQFVPQLTCLHPKGQRNNPVPVAANGVVSGTRIRYETNHGDKSSV